MELKAHVWFPTLIWQANLPEGEREIISSMKDSILEERKNDPEGVRKTNYGGWQSKTRGEFLESFKVIGDKLDETIKTCAQQINVPELKLQGYWSNINSYGDYNTLHNHKASIMSGVFYVDVPDENMGNINFFRADDIAYYLPPLKEYNNFTGEKASYKPETGKVLIFPSWLQHSVDGCRSKKERISISFNYGV